MWIQYALLSSFLWAIVHVLDEHCVDKIFSKPWLGVITSSGISAGIFLLVPLLNIPIVIPHWDLLVICLLTGAIIQLSQFFYFRALDCSDSGTVAAYWNLTPIFLILISYWLFGYLITSSNYIGIVLLIIASIGLCAVDKFSNRWDTLYLMSIASGLLTIVMTIEKYIFDRTDFFGAFLSITAGMIISGLACLTLPEVRLTLVGDFPKIKQALPIFIAIELLNLVALYTGQIAVKLGVPVVVSAIEASTPAYVFGLSFLIAICQRRIDSPAERLCLTARYRQRQREAQRKLPLKWGFVSLTIAGVWLLSMT
jgi:uncharacterized membrane protein